MTGNRRCATGFKVIHEVGDPTFLVAAIVGTDARSKIARYRVARRMVGRLHPRLEVRPDILPHLGCQVAHAMYPRHRSGLIDTLGGRQYSSE